MSNESIFSKIWETTDPHTGDKNAGKFVIGGRPKPGHGKRMLVEQIKNSCIAKNSLGYVIVKDADVAGDVAVGVEGVHG